VPPFDPCLASCVAVCPQLPQQLVQEFKLLLLLGRRLVFPVQPTAAVSTDVTTQVQLKAADDSIVACTVSLMFPGNCRTVVRLMEAWYEAQVGMALG